MEENNEHAPDNDMETKYWNVNVDRNQWTRDCPEFLASVDHWDRAQLSVRDEDYELMSWEVVKDLIATNHLEQFKRIPSNLRRYRKYIADLKQNYGSVMEFIMQERVKWHDLNPKGGPFEQSEDMRILFNDWPYGIDPDIVHLVVWTKFGFEEDPATGDLTANAKQQINSFVEQTFGRREGSDVVWFKNWAALKSVHAVEHFHVMLYKPDQEFVRNITNGDEPMAKKLKG